MSEISEVKETGRIEAFSDGVFAIAITLLVLGIEPPRASDFGPGGGLALALMRLWPHYLAFVTSFAAILVMWVNHHRIFGLIQKTDHPFMYWNGLLLMLVTFMPFPTVLLAEFLVHPEAKVAGEVYAGTLVAINLAFTGLWRNASKDGRLLLGSADKRDIGLITKKLRLGTVMCFAAFGFSFVSVWLSIGLFICIAVFFGLKG